jgi:methionyl-tRNA synthetase
LAHPVLPDSTAKIWTLLGQPATVSAVELDGLRWGHLATGVSLGKPQTLFPRVEKSEAIARIESMANEELNPTAAPAPTAGASAATPAASEKIGIEDFAKVEMRVGQIKTAERIVGADKLLKVAVVVNLAPRKLRGVESNGMIIAASAGPEGRPVLAGFPEDVEVGARLK